VLRVFLRTIFRWLRQRAARRGIIGGRGGAVTAIQRFGTLGRRTVRRERVLRATTTTQVARRQKTPVQSMAWMGS